MLMILRLIFSRPWISAVHPGKFTWNPKIEVLQDEFPSQLGDFGGSMLISRVYSTHF